MSKLDEKLKASVKPARSKTTEPAKAAATVKPASKPAAPPKAEKKPAPVPLKTVAATDPGTTSGLFPDRVWPD